MCSGRCSWWPRCCSAEWGRGGTGWSWPQEAAAWWAGDLWTGLPVTSALFYVGPMTTLHVEGFVNVDFYSIVPLPGEGVCSSIHLSPCSSTSALRSRKPSAPPAADAKACPAGVPGGSAGRHGPLPSVNSTPHLGFPLISLASSFSSSLSFSRGLAFLASGSCGLGSEAGTSHGRGFHRGLPVKLLTSHPACLGEDEIRRYL